MAENQTRYNKAAALLHDDSTENGTFNVMTRRGVVRYGAGSSWVSQTISGGGTCSNTFFGTDPDPGVVKSCQVATAAPAPAPAPSNSTVATENGTFNVASGTVVQYGAGSSWVSKTVSGAGTCSNTFFGTDPDPGVVKSCQVATAAAPAAHR